MTKCILIIEDEPDLRQIARLSIECFTDWQADTAATGVEGLQKASTLAFDAILLDISMPGMDGFQVVEHLRSHPKTQTIPVILLTAKVQPNDQHRFATMDVTGIITKPFASETLAYQVAQLMGWSIESC